MEGGLGGRGAVGMEWDGVGWGGGGDGGESDGGREMRLHFDLFSRSRALCLMPCSGHHYWRPG